MCIIKIMSKKLGLVSALIIALLMWVISSRVDMLQAQEPVKLGDVDRDGDVDVADYGLALRYFETSESSADFNQNGMVDIYDVNQVISSILITLSPELVEKPEVGNSLGESGELQ